MIQPPLGYTFPCTYVRTIDGDTVIVKLFDREWHVRIMTLLAPENHGSKNCSYVIDGKKVTGIESAAYMKSLMEKAKVVILHIPFASHGSIGEYFTFDRVRGMIFADGQDVAELMIAANKAKRNEEWK